MSRDAWRHIDNNRIVGRLSAKLSDPRMPTVVTDDHRGKLSFEAFTSNVRRRKLSSDVFLLSRRFDRTSSNLENHRDGRRIRHADVFNPIERSRGKSARGFAGQISMIALDRRVSPPRATKSSHRGLANVERARKFREAKLESVPGEPSDRPIDAS